MDDRSRRHERAMSFDWNRAAGVVRLFRPGVTLLDETLRDGLQNPSVRDPPIGEKIGLLHRMDALGIHAVNLGLPASSSRNREDVVELAREIARGRLRIAACAAGRTVVEDLAPIAGASQRSGIPIEAYAFIGSSGIRRYVERWDLASVLRRSAEAISFAVREGIRVCYVTEDTTRTDPQTLRALFVNAIEHGARAICLTDTVGHATPDGVSALVSFAREVASSTGQSVRIDWHGHNDRGICLPNAFWALQAGADRVHATALGIGERVGNVPMEMVLLNLLARGELRVDLSELWAYCGDAARALGWQIPPNHPATPQGRPRMTKGMVVGARVECTPSKR
jgi:2-isopropylmalate synthase